MSNQKLIFLFSSLLLSVFLFHNRALALECRNSPGGYCAYSTSDCTSNGGHVDSSYDCIGESADDFCCVPGAAETPTPTPSAECQYVCVPANSCSVTASGFCGTGVCCQTQANDATDCTNNGGACFPSSTACYGGVENTLSYACNSGQHCCRQTVDTCTDNGGTCVANATACDNILQYSCGEGGGTCCDTGENSTDEGSTPWESGLIKANQAANLPDSDIDTITSKTLAYILSFFTILSVLFFVITGLKYIMAGSTGSAEKSKLGISHLITGLVVGLSGYIIVKLINYILGG